MPMNITCPDCGSGFVVSRSDAGRRIKCPKCGTPIPVPDAAPTVTPHRRRGESSRRTGPKFRSDGYASKGRWTPRTALRWVGLWALALAAIWLGLRTLVKPPPMVVE